MTDMTVVPPHCGKPRDKKGTDGHDPSSSQQMDTPSFGTAPLTQVPKSTQVLVHTSDIATQLRSMQSVMTTVGQLGGQMRSLQAEVTEMENAEDDE